MKSNIFNNYLQYVELLYHTLINCINQEVLVEFADDLIVCRREGKQLFICGNGGSAGNAMHLANDFLYGARDKDGRGIRVNALTSNSAVITCLANDTGYEKIFSEQLSTFGSEGDLLLVLSGSGESQNIIEAVKKSKEIGIKSYAILGYEGGEIVKMVDKALHFKIQDMQISEDIQLIIGHILMKYLKSI
jgi:D-sedoheptulose 7-phosphate isomerase